MTNLKSLMANLSEVKMDVLSSDQLTNLKGGCGNSYGGGKSGKQNKSGKNKSGKNGGYGGGYGCGCYTPPPPPPCCCHH